MNNIFHFMTDELKKLVFFLLNLAGAGTLYCMVIFLIPIIMSHIDIISKVLSLYCLWAIDIIIFSGLIVIISIISLLAISQAVSHIGIYHKLKKSETNEGEAFWTKVCRVLWWNCILTIFIFITIVNIIQPSTEILQNYSSFSQNDLAFLCATILIPGYLLSLRLLANPGNWVKNFPYYGRLTQSDIIIESIKIFKERVLSFYFSLIGVVFIYIVIKFLYEGLINISVGASADQFTSNFTGIYIPHPSIVIIGILPYLIALALVTIMGELILKYAEPIEQI